MFQLFDTGRVFNLTEAMNLYEDLKWKNEMKQMLGELINKVSKLITITSHIEYYSKCALENNNKTNSLLNKISMNQKDIICSQNAIAINTSVIAQNIETMKLYQQYDILYK